MRPWIELCQAAGFGSQVSRVLQVSVGSSSLLGLAIWLVTAVPGLGISAGVLALGLAIEVLRVLANRRQAVLDQSWPAVFDLMRSGTQAGLSLDEQFRYLADEGPKPLRGPFAQLALDAEWGLGIEAALARFQRTVGSRSGDHLALVISIATELGGRGLVDIWSKAATAIRAELEMLGGIRARQSWVLASSKLALVAPWVVAGMLLGPPGNRELFASAAGTTVLLFGLIFSCSAYFMTNWLGRLQLPGRVFHAV